MACANMLDLIALSFHTLLTRIQQKIAEGPQVKLLWKIAEDPGTQYIYVHVEEHNIPAIFPDPYI